MNKKVFNKNAKQSIFEKYLKDICNFKPNYGALYRERSMLYIVLKKIRRCKNKDFAFFKS